MWRTNYNIIESPRIPPSLITILTAMIDIQKTKEQICLGIPDHNSITADNWFTEVAGHQITHEISIFSTWIVLHADCLAITSPEFSAGADCFKIRKWFLYLDDNNLWWKEEDWFTQITVLCFLCLFGSPLKLWSTLLNLGEKVQFNSTPLSGFKQVSQGSPCHKRP